MCESEREMVKQAREREREGELRESKKERMINSKRERMRESTFERKILRGSTPTTLNGPYVVCG